MQVLTLSHTSSHWSTRSWPVWPKLVPAKSAAARVAMVIFILMRGFDSLTGFAKIVVVPGMKIELLDVLKLTAFLLKS